MARNAKNKKEAGASHLRLVHDATKKPKPPKKPFTSALAAQLDQFADDLDREIEAIKNW